MDSDIDQLPAAPAVPAPRRPTAVVMDLFGTLVVAPDSRERAQAVREMATALRVPEPIADRALGGSWQARHDGTLRTTTDVATYLAAECAAPLGTVSRLESVLRRLAPMRLAADPTVMQCLIELRCAGLRLGLLSDASPDIAEAWERSALAAYFDAAHFSCREGAVKPARSLYTRVLTHLGSEAQFTVYCGDDGGAELLGARRCGLRTIRVERRGGPTTLAFGRCSHIRQVITLRSVEELPARLGIRPSAMEVVR